MPKRVHEELICSMQTQITNQLEVIRDGGGPAATLAQNITSLGSTDLYLQDGGKRSPDMQFEYIGAQYPGLIIEVACTQSMKNLDRLADLYIVESSGNTKTVIGLSVDYGEGKKATVSVWRPKYGVDKEGGYLASEEIVRAEVCEIHHWQ